MRSVIILSFLFVLILMAVPVSAESPTITSFSPTSCYQGTATTFTITGSGFNTSSSVLLMKSGVENVTASTISSATSEQIVCTFSSAKLSAMNTGSWNFVVINPDNTEGKASTALTLRAPMTLTSITPASGRTNNASVAISVAGTGLSDVTSIYLYNEDYSNISATGIDPISSVKVNGILNLNSKEVDTYSVCVKDSANTHVCGLSFKITSDAVGNIDITSSPSGATFYLGGVNKGTTPINVTDLEAGTYKIMVKKDGYADWMRSVKVTAGKTESYSANLEVKTTATTATPSPTPTTVPTTIKVTRKQTTATATPWPSDTPTPASPVDALVIVGGIGLALVALRRK